MSTGKADSKYPAEVSIRLRASLDSDGIARVMQAMRKCPVGLDNVLARSIAFGAAYHHAGSVWQYSYLAIYLLYYFYSYILCLSHWIQKIRCHHVAQSMGIRLTLMGVQPAGQAQCYFLFFMQKHF